MICFTENPINKVQIQIYSKQSHCVKLTSVQSLLEVNRGLMVVPKPTMLSLVPEGRLFNATTMASCGNKTGLTGYGRINIHA